MIPPFASIVIAVFAAVLEKTPTENDLTV